MLPLQLQSFIDIIKVLLYQNDESLFEKLNFDDDTNFLEPLTFVYFNHKSIFSSDALYEILQGYFMEKEPLVIVNSINKNGIAYNPNLGYFKKGEAQPFHDIEMINGTSIEILLHPTPYLDPIFKDRKENPIAPKNIEISPKLINQHLPQLTRAFSYIKQAVPEHFLRNFLRRKNQRKRV